MVNVGDTAPDFAAPMAADSIESFTLSEHLGDGPVVLAFFPAAFTSTCMTELNTFQDRLSEFEAAGADVYGISIDTPFTLGELRDQHGIEYPLISDTNRKIIDLYDVSMDFVDLGVYELAKRSVFVIDSEGIVTYTWESDDPSVEPDYEAVSEAAAAAE